MVSILVILELALEAFRFWETLQDLLVSILVILELALEVSLSAGVSELQRFQSLLFWNWLQKPSAACVVSSTINVSILVILELALEVLLQTLQVLQVRVSILVILELALEAQQGITRCSDTSSFNPCYSGIGFRSIWRNREEKIASKFQSLLFWNWLQKRSRSCRRHGRILVSILVILELALEEGDHPLMKTKDMLFQSLLFWNWLQKLYPPIWAIVSEMFQSLLFWNWLQKYSTVQK